MREPSVGFKRNCRNRAYTLSPSRTRPRSGSAGHPPRTCREPHYVYLLVQRVSPGRRLRWLVRSSTRPSNEAWDCISIFLQSVDHAGTWNEVKQHVGQEMGKDPKYHVSAWHGDANHITQFQAAIVKWHKDEGHRKSHHILVCIDDFADRPEVVHQFNGGGILNSLFTRCCHCMISTGICCRSVRADQQPFARTQLAYTHGTSARPKRWRCYFRSTVHWCQGVRRP